MAYRLKPGEPIGKGFTRVGLEQLERAARDIAGDDHALGVHETRKTLKRLRALLRLASGGLDEDTFRRENARLRNIGRLLSGARDRHVIATTLTALEARAGSQAAASLTAARAALASLEGHEVAGGGRQAALREIAVAQQAFGEIVLTGDTFDVLAPGLKRAYAEGRKAFGHGHGTESDEEYHEARKLVQQHWRHMALLTRAWPGELAARVKLARALSEILGRDHDLALVSAFAADRLTPHHARGLNRLARETQAELRARAAPLGNMLYAEKPSALVDRLGICWTVASRVADIDGEAVGRPAADIGSGRSKP